MTAAARQMVEFSGMSKATIPESATARLDPEVHDKGIVLEDVALPVPLRSADREFDELLAAQSSNVQLVVCNLFPELLQDISAHQPVQQHLVLPTMTTDVIQHVVNAEVQQADE